MKFRGTLRSALAALVTALLAAVVLLVPNQVASAAINCVGSTDRVYVDGIFQVGETLKGSIGNWDSGFSLDFRWKTSTSTLQTGASATYTVPESVSGQSISLTVVGTKVGCATSTSISSSSFYVAPSGEFPFTGGRLYGAMVAGNQIGIAPSAADIAAGITPTCMISIEMPTGAVDDQSCDRPIPSVSSGKRVHYRQTVTLNGLTYTRSGTERVSDMVGPDDNTFEFRSAPIVTGRFSSGQSVSIRAYSESGTVALSRCKVGKLIDTCSTPSSPWTLAPSEVGAQYYIKADYVESDGRTYTAFSPLTPVVARYFASTLPQPVWKDSTGSTSIIHDRLAIWYLSASTPSSMPEGATSELFYGKYAFSGQRVTVASQKIILGVGDQIVARSVTRLADGSTIEHVSAPYGVVQYRTFSAKTVGVSGSFVTFQTLTATQPYTLAGSAYSYQWYRDGNMISGATLPTYSLTVDDTDHAVSVRVRVTCQGYYPITVESLATTVSPADLTNVPNPAVRGTYKVGNTLTINWGAWDDGVQLDCYVHVAGARRELPCSATSYVIEGFAFGSSIHFEAVGSKPGYKSVTRWSDFRSISPAVLGATPVPTFQGNVSAGNTLVANPGTWDTGVTLSYQWYRSTGVALKDETSESLLLKAEHVGIGVYVAVTGVKQGYVTVTQRSITSSTIQPGLAADPAPSIQGIHKVGETLTASPGSWNQAVNLEYQWYRNDVPISGANYSSYKLTPKDAGTVIMFKVTASAATFVDVTLTSLPTSIITGAFPNLPAPNISGLTQVNQVLTTSTPNWGNEAIVTYQWFKNGAQIAGATSPSYLLKVTDLGSVIAVRVTAKHVGYETIDAFSANTPPISAAPVTVARPTVTGTFAVGKTLAAKTTGLLPGSVLSYQWLRGGKPIAGATKSSYKLVKADSKQLISLRILVKLVGHQSATSTSVAKKTL